MANVETSSEKLAYKDAVINAIVETLKEGDGSNLKYYENSILRTIQNEFGVGNIKSLRELNSGVDKKFAGNLFQTLKNRIVSQHQRIDERTASLKKEKENLLRSEDTLHRILSANGITLEDAETPEEITEVETIKEQKDFTDEPTPEPYVGITEPTEKEISAEAEKVRAYIKNWLLSGKDEYMAKLSGPTYMHGDDIMFGSKEFDENLKAFLNINPDKIEKDDLRRDVESLREDISKLGLTMLFSGMNKDGSKMEE